MRLAVFTNQYPSPVSTFFSRDMASLVAAGVDVHVFSLYPLEARHWRYVPQGVPERLRGSNAVHHPQAMQMAAGTLRAAPLLRYASGPVRSALRGGMTAVAKTAYTAPLAVTWARQFDGYFDHILAYWANYAGTCAWLFRRCMEQRVPLSMVVHAGIDLYYNQHFLREKLLDSENVFVVCDFNRQQLRIMYPRDWGALEQRIQVHHPGLDLDELAFSRESRTPGSLVTVGRLIRLKGTEYLLRALRRLLDSGNCVTLDVVGDGPELARLMRMCTDLGVASQVRFRGWLTWAEVRTLIGSSACLVHPSIPFGDAAPTVVKESLALGTPVIASAIGGIPELLDGGRCGVLVRPEDPAALADAVQRLLRDESERARLASAGRAFAERTFDQWKNGAAMAARLCRTVSAPATTGR